jgi:hypothetical protein
VLAFVVEPSSRLVYYDSHNNGRVEIIVDVQVEEASSALVHAPAGMFRDLLEVAVASELVVLGWEAHNALLALEVVV